MESAWATSSFLRGGAETQGLSFGGESRLLWGGRNGPTGPPESFAWFQPRPLPSSFALFFFFESCVTCF